MKEEINIEMLKKTVTTNDNSSKGTLYPVFICKLV